ncbi:hypothetical protein [Halalkalicoccus tibetensis]|uniref:Uncharacterized protein n=1 Tax=Halalkalicoccus tibetensis TaxID=175632 RepID=A0ABD5V2P1_9EURY
MVDQLRVHQEEIAHIRDELDEQAEAYEFLDEAVESVSKGIDNGTIEWRLASEDIRPVCESNTTTED